MPSYFSHPEFLLVAVSRRTSPVITRPARANCDLCIAFERLALGVPWLDGESKNGGLGLTKDGGRCSPKMASFIGK